jgi:DNA polymerase-3 subunit epsilon
MVLKLFRASPDSAPREASSFVVLDVETTGLFPTKHDRIIEIALVRLDEAGHPLEEFVTLVNPERDIGPTRIHGISARDVLGAPLFSEIAGDVIARIEGTVLVAHNARFDSDFLAAEFSRLGFQLPKSPMVCTLHLARTGRIPVASYKLGSMCKELNIPHPGVHAALNDARATAMLFSMLLRRVWTSKSKRLMDLGCESEIIPPTSRWPRLTPTGKRLERSSIPPQESPSFLSSLVTRLAPAAMAGSSAAADEYIDLLNRALEDRRVTAEEGDLLLETANRWGLAREDVAAIHQNYLVALVNAALQDGIVTKAESSDLYEVGRLLGFEAVYADQLITRAPGIRMPAASAPTALVGLSVCFTGESICERNGVPLTRSDAEQLAVGAGLTVAVNVTKRLDILVLADPDSMSGKAQKARRYGVRLMAERVFWQQIGVEVD